MRMRVGAVLDGRADLIEEVTKDSAMWTGNLWKKKFLPLHFTREGGRKYDYVKRAFQYTMRKLREEGHSHPMRKSGKTRSRLMSQAMGIQSKGFWQWVVRLPLPHIPFTIFTVTSLKSDRRKRAWEPKGETPLLTEIRTITRDEIQHLSTEGAERWVRQLTRIEQTRERIYTWR